MRFSVLHPETGRRFPSLLLRWFSGICALLVLMRVGSMFASGTVDRYSVIQEAQAKVVKIYGAGGLRRMESYQTGILISPEGHILTAQSYVLDTDEVTAVLDDGRRLTAVEVGYDPVRELTVLKLPLEGESLPHFDLSRAVAAEPGQRVLALSNLYGIAAGDEAVSVLQGVVTAVAPLEARRGVFQSHYRDLVYVVDAPSNNPGAAGGALIDWQGRLLGVLGKELKSEVTGSWLNYALPVRQFEKTVEDIIAGRSFEAPSAELAAPEEPLTLEDLGVVLTPNLLPRTPPYVDQLIPGSSAAALGVQPDDLIVFVAGQPTSSCTEVQEAAARRERYQPLRISLLRDGRLIEVDLTAIGAETDP